MESSAYEALMTGVNVLVFIIALTASIMLMTTVNDMSTYANTIMTAKSGNSALYEDYKDNEERIYTFKEMVTYNYRINKQNAKLDDKNKITVNVKISEEAKPVSLNSYLEDNFKATNTTSSVNDEYALKVINDNNYLFIKK